MDFPLSPRAKAGGVVVLVLVGLGCAVVVSALGDHGTVTPVLPVSTASAAGGSGTAIYVHILGAVARPGLYELRDGDRAVDAVAAAGGFLEDADQAQLNLARFVVDGEQIVVPVVGEVPTTAPGTTSNGLVNLNTADAATLDTLPRVGPAMAARIIEWREANGPFVVIEDLLGITGIGDKTFEGLRDLVTT
ncbi:MAG: ComEA family DNA-binding protein [Salinibacterium sp.]|nr:ComEA family DNA-binding protein [Salinibacterium sp.]